MKGSNHPVSAILSTSYLHVCRCFIGIHKWFFFFFHLIIIIIPILCMIINLERRRTICGRHETYESNEIAKTAANEAHLFIYILLATSYLYGQ